MIMKKFSDIVFGALGVVAAASVVLVSCGKDPSVVGGGEDPAKSGTFKLASLTADTDFKVVVRGGAGVAEGDVSVGDFGVSLKNPAGEVIKSWETFSAMDPIVTVPSGDYNIDVNSGNLKPAAFEAPYYAGSAAFKVAVQQLTNVEVVATLANTKVTVGYSDSFLSQVKDVAVVVNNGVSVTDGAIPGILTYTVDEMRAGYFAVTAERMLSVQVTGTRIADGKPVSETIRVHEVDARQWHKITIDVSTVGTTQSVVKINHELIIKDGEVVIPGADDMIPGNDDEWDDLDPEPPVVGGAPEIIGQSFNGVAFDFGSPITVHVGTSDVPVTNVLDVVLKASNGGIAKLLLTIDCAALADLLPMMGITGEIDLANPPADAEWASLFADESIGIIDPLVPIAGKTQHTFSVGGLMNMLGMVMVDTADNTARFHITVVDGNGAQVTKVLSVVVVE